MQSDTRTVSHLQSFFKKTGIIIAIFGQKSLHWPLSKAVPSGVFNSHCEAIN